MQKKHSGKLLTGDAALRKHAEQNKIMVHGILWVFDELVDQRIITRIQAHDKLTRLLSINPRLPGVECKKRLKKWK